MSKGNISAFLFLLLAMLSNACSQNNAQDQLVIGSLLAHESAYSNGMVQAADMAIEEVSAAGNPITLLKRSSSTDLNVAGAGADYFIREGVSVVLGAADTRSSLFVIDRLTDRDIVMIASSNVSPTFTDYPDKGLYFPNFCF